MHRQGNESHACYLDRNANLIGDCVFHPDSLNDNVNTSIMFMSQLQDVSDILFSVIQKL